MPTITPDVILITGSARRIGAEIASFLHQKSKRIVIHYHHSADEARALSSALNVKRADSALAIQADLADPLTFQPMIQQILAHWGRLDAIIHNASCFFPTPFEKTTHEQWHQLFNTNVLAPFFLSQAALAPLKENKGSIIHITDIHADRPLKEYSVYTATKAALTMLTKSLAKDLGPDIRVNAVAPGLIAWPEGKNALSAETQQRLIEKTALHRSGSPQDIAQAVAYLLEAPYVTGEIIHVDGGRLLST